MAQKIIGSEIERLIQLLGRLPGLGPRSARRAVLHLVRKREELLAPLSEAIKQVHDKIITCSNCGNIDTQDPCSICTDPLRDSSVLIVVETIADLWALERASAVAGRYHVLGGALSPLDGIEPKDLSFDLLLSRINKNPINEVILAVNATVDGQTTAHYIIHMLKNFPGKTTKLASGIPLGGELDYLDDGTLSNALRRRTMFE